MKHLLRRFLCVGLFLALLCGAGSALAAQGTNADFFLTQLMAQEQGYEDLDYPQSAVAAGDTLYIHTNRGLYRWKAGMERPEALLSFSQGPEEEDQPAQTPDPSATADPLVELTEALRGYFYSTLLTDGKRLLLLRMEEGALWQLTNEAGELAPALDHTLDFSPLLGPEGEDYHYPSIQDVALTDGWLYIAAIDYEQSQTPMLYRWELASGKAGEPLSCQITSLAPYKDGLFLCLLVDQEAWSAEKEPTARLATFDPKTNAFTELFSAGKHSAIGLAYNPENDTAYYMEESVVYSLPGLALPAKKSAYMLNRTWDNMGAGRMQGGLYYQAGSEGVSIRALDQPGMENGALSVYGVYYSPAHVAFASLHPEIPVALSGEYYSSLEAFAAAMVSGQDAVDVLRVYASSTPMNQLIDKGYALDLSGNAQVMAAADAMYPALVDGYRRDGKLYALPVDMYAGSLGYYQSALRELGLTQADLPATWMELLDFIANWQEDYGEDYPDVQLTDTMDMKDSLLYSLMESYAAYSMKTWGRLDFDAPLFAKLMGGYDAIDFGPLSPSGGDSSELVESGYDEAFWNAKHLFSFYTDYNQMQYFAQERQEGDWISTPLPLPLEEGLDIVVPATQGVMMINPRTTRPEQAQLYLSTVAQYYDKTSTNITLFPDHNDPVPNLSFEAEVDSWQKELTRVQKALETAAPEERANLEDSEKIITEWIANSDSNRYAVRAEAIAWYREHIAPYLYPMGQTPLNTWREGQENQLYALMQQYKEGALPLERFLKEIGNRVRMMELEDR